MASERRLQSCGVLSALVLSLWLLLAQVATAQEHAAELRSATGTVFAQPQGGQVRLVQQGAKFKVGDTIGTEKGAFALVVFADGSRVALRPESALAIKAFAYKPEDPAQDQMSVQLLKGWLRNVSGQIGKRGSQDAYEMKAADTTIGIRGTDFAVRLCDEACAKGGAKADEGVLPQSGRLGQIQSTSQPLLLTRSTEVPRTVEDGETLRLGDTVSTGPAEALLGLDDGTRVVLGPQSSVALRAEEDDRGRRAVRLDLLQGAMRIATATQPGARLYGVLVQAGATIGLKPDTAIDLSCGASAEGFAYACPISDVNLRKGQAEILSRAGLKPLKRDKTETLRDPNWKAPAGSSATPAAQAERNTVASRLSWQLVTSRFSNGHPIGLISVAAASGKPDPFRSTWSDYDDAGSVDRGTGWLLAQATPGSPAGPTVAPSPQNLLDPMNIPADAVRPPVVSAPPTQGVYTAVFEGAVAVGTPRGQIVVPSGQAAYSPLDGLKPPTPLPAAPAFMEKDKTLEKAKLSPTQCVK
jgi:ferric-dicitrate binding protein FerR (iron transport regulator)